MAVIRSDPYGILPKSLGSFIAEMNKGSTLRVDSCGWCVKAETLIMCRRWIEYVTDAFTSSLVFNILKQFAFGDSIWSNTGFLVVTDEAMNKLEIPLPDKQTIWLQFMAEYLGCDIAEVVYLCVEGSYLAMEKLPYIKTKGA